MKEATTKNKRQERKNHLEHVRNLKHKRQDIENNDKNCMKNI